MTEQTKVAWLAGLVDGEGSVGIHKTGRGQMVACIQMSNTCELTMSVARQALADIGITAVAHHHQERDPTKHRDAHYWRVSRVADVVKLCLALMPYSVTKQHQLTLLSQFAESMVGEQVLDAIGRISSRSRKPYTEVERELQRRVSILNLRGAASMQAQA